MADLAERNPKVEVLGHYEGASVPIAVRCRECGREWTAIPSRLLRGQGCSTCSRHARRKTHEQFLEEVARNNPDLEVLGTYVDSRMPILMHCRICGYVWSPNSNSVARGSGCPRCAAARATKPHEQFVEEVALHNPNVRIVGEYKGSHERIHARCTICGNDWYPVAGSLLRGSGCPRCGARHRVKSPEDFAREAEERNHKVTVIGRYEDSRTKVSVRCNFCGREWLMIPASVLRGHGCPHCTPHASARGERTDGAAALTR